VQVTNNLPTYAPRGFVHQPPNGGQFGDSSRGSLSGINLLEEPPFNPHVRFMDGQHLICACLYHHGINHLLCNLHQNQQPNYHIGSYNI
jgi:hypothetical protein